MTYSEKLRDPRWQKKRLEIMQRDGFACQGCGSETNTLNVHHSYYIPRADPWDYPDKHLRTYCEGCHEQKHDAINGLLAVLTEVSAGSILGITEAVCAVMDCESIQDARTRMRAWIASAPSPHYPEPADSMPEPAPEPKAEPAIPSDEVARMLERLRTGVRREGK